jgi:ribonucleoside-diphosphate reductase beta chain
MSNLLEPTEIFVPKYLQFHEILEEHERGHWNIAEIDTRIDVEQWKKGTITDSEKAYIKNVLRLFTQADTNVCASYVERLLPLFKNADARMMLLSFASREVTHMKGYRQLNETLGYDSAEFMSEFMSFKEMKDKHDFMIEAVPLTTEADIALYLAKQVLMEGVNLFGSFVQLLSFSQEGKSPGMVAVNKWSITDESLHVRGLCALFGQFISENPRVVNNHFKAEIYETARKVVGMEDAFIDLCYAAGTNKNLTAADAKLYVRYVCDYRMQQLGLKAQFGVKENPVPWVDLITSNTFANFFEATSVEYSKNSMVGDWGYP